MNIGGVNMDRVLGPVSMHLAIDWHQADMVDGIELRTRAYEADRQGYPMRGGDSVYGITTIMQPALRVAQVGGTGALVDLVRREVSGAAERIIRHYLVRQMFRGAAFAFFAMDHDEGHGPDMAEGLRTLWAQSPECWPSYLEKQKTIMRWLEEAPR